MHFDFSFQTFINRIWNFGREKKKCTAEGKPVSLL